MKTTIKEVATEAKVSTATVSLALNNHPRISPRTRETVIKAAKKLNYYPSRSARALVSKRTGNIGFVLTKDRFLRTEPFYTKIFLGTEFEANNLDYYVFLTVINSNYSKNDSLPRFILEKNIDGIIVAGKVDDEFLAKVKKYKIPLVLIDYIPKKGNYNVIMMDNINGTMSAIDYLSDLGHKNIAFIGGDMNHPSINERFKGYKFALKNNNLKLNKDLIFTNYSKPNRENGYIAAKGLLAVKKSFSAVFCCNDAMALGLIDYLKDNEPSLLNKISIIGFDDIEDDTRVTPSLSTVRVRKIDLGAEAVKLLVKKIRSKDMADTKIIVPTDLLLRESTRSIRNII